MTLGSLPAKSNVKDIEREDLKNKRRGRGGRNKRTHQEPRTKNQHIRHVLEVQGITKEAQSPRD